MKSLFTLFLFTILTIQLQSQDAHFSQFFDSNRAFTNPAFTGIDGGLSINANYRNQWFKIPGLFETEYLSVQANSPCINSAFGLHLLHNQEGEGKLNTLNAAFDYVYILKLKEYNNDIRIGLSANWTRKWIAWDELVFSDQLHFKEGILDNSVSMADRNGNTPTSMGFKAGFAHRFDIDRKGNKDIKVSYGLGISHIGNFAFTESTPDGFYGTDPLAWRYSFYSGFILPFMRYVGPKGYEFLIIPHLRYDQQSKIKKTTLGATAHYGNLSLGIFYQNTFPWGSNTNTDAMIGYLGYFLPSSKKMDMEIGISYDSNNVPTSLNSSNLGGLTNGVIEINFRFLFYNKTFLCRQKKRGNNKRRKVSCPSLMSDYRSKVREYGNNNNFSRRKKSK